jgi:hypothetical protein
VGFAVLALMLGLDYGGFWGGGGFDCFLEIVFF